jgi:hypothetical protein
MIKLSLSVKFLKCKYSLFLFILQMNLKNDTADVTFRKVSDIK